MSEKTSFSGIEKMKMAAKDPKYVPGMEAVVAQPAVVIPQAMAPNGLTPAREVLPRAVDGPEPSLYVPSLPSTNRPAEVGQVLRTRCKQLGMSLFFNGDTPVRSLGFTSAIAGEGKTFLARATAEVMAEDNSIPVTLLECNWVHPTFSSAYNLPPSPGLSEWLFGRCPLEAIRRQVKTSLTVIPSGDSSYNATQLLRTLQQRGLHSVLTYPNEILIVDLPTAVTTAYGPLAAQLADALILVVRMGVTPESYVTEACHYLRPAHVHGVIFNQVTSRIPGWLRKIL